MSNVLLVRGIETPSVRWWHTENSWSSNSYLAMEGGTLYIVDSGLGSLHRGPLLEAVARFPQAERAVLLNTHWHLDHAGNGMILSELRHTIAEVGYYVPEVAKEYMQNFKENSNVGVEVDMAISAAQWLKEADKEEFDFGGVAFMGWRIEEAYLLATPGHSPDSVSVYLEDEKAIFPGDVLWYVNPNVLEGGIESLLTSIAQLRRLVAVEGIDYLGQTHFLPIEGRNKIIDHISEYEEKEKVLITELEDVVADSDRVSVDQCLERLRQSEHPAIKEAIRINYPYFPSYLHRFIHVFFRERRWHEVETGTWSHGAPS